MSFPRVADVDSQVDDFQNVRAGLPAHVPPDVDRLSAAPVTGHSFGLAVAEEDLVGDLGGWMAKHDDTSHRTYHPAPWSDTGHVRPGSSCGRARRRGGRRPRRRAA